MADFKQLKAQLMSLQQVPVKPRLSERNIVEVVRKLMDTRSLSLYFSSNGKEFLTPSHLEAEILAEVRRLGRVSLLDLPGLLGVNIEFVERHTKALVGTRRDLKLVDGQLICDEHLDVLAQEVDALIALSGQVSLSELARKFSLPSDFLQSQLSRRQGTILHGQVKDTQIVTNIYLQQHYARLRGSLRACTEPFAVKSFDQSLVHTQISDMIQKGEVRGTLSSLTFTPAVYTETLASTIQTLYKSSLVIDYDTVRRIAHLQTVAEAKKTLNELIPGGMHLETCYIDSGLQAALKGEVAAALKSRKVVKCREHLELPGPIHTSDLGHLVSDSEGVFILEDTIWTEEALADVASTFEPMIRRVAEEQKTAMQQPQTAKGAKKRGRGDGLSNTEVANHLKKSRVLDKYQLSDLESGYDSLATRLYPRLLHSLDLAKDVPAPPSAKKREPKSFDLTEDFFLLQLHTKAISVLSTKFGNTNPLQVHLAKTLFPTFYVNLLKVQMENQGVPPAEGMKFADRGQFLSSLPEYLQAVFNRLSEHIRERKLDDFIGYLLETKKDLPAVTLQVLDKKKERVVLHKQRVALKENLQLTLAGNQYGDMALGAGLLKLLDCAGVVVCAPGESWALQVLLGACRAFCPEEDDFIGFLSTFLSSPDPDSLSALQARLSSLITS